MSFFERGVLGGIICGDGGSGFKGLVSVVSLKCFLDIECMVCDLGEYGIGVMFGYYECVVGI